MKLKKFLSIILSIFMLLSIIGGHDYVVNAATTDYEYDVLEDGTIEIVAYTGSEEQVTIPSTIKNKKVTSIGDEAFKDNEDLQKVILPDTINHIGMDAFVGTPFYVNKENWEDNALYIDDYLIRVKTKVKGDYAIKDGVKSIADGAFSECAGLTSVTIPDSVKNIGLGIFNQCASLKKVTFPKNIKTIPMGIFLACTSLKDITIPETVTSVDEMAFYGCTGLTSVTLPKNIKKIKGMVFAGCTSLKNITIPETVTNIETMAFLGCSALKSITIPKKVTNLGMAAFYGCESLTTFTIPNGVKLIDDGLLSGCSKLTTVTIPKTVTKIGEEAFSECPNLTTVNYKGTVAQWKKIKIDSTNTVLTKLTIKCSDGKTKNLKATTVKSLTPMDKSLKVTWVKTSGITGYQVQIATDNKFTKNKKTYTVKETSKTITGLKSNQKYYVRVRTYKGKNYSDWSKTSTGTTKLASTTFKNFSKTNQSVSMTWKKVTGVTGYQVEIATNSKFTQNKTTIKTKATEKTFSKLKSKTKYYVRIRTYKGKKYSDWSKTNSITTK